METYTDYHLILLVSLTNSADLEMGITLTVPGGIVTGNLISFSSWCKKQAHLVTPFHSLGFSAYSDFLNNAAKELEQERADKYAIEAIKKEDDPLFINLSEARFLTSEGPLLSNPESLWRGKLSDVSGWMLGKLMKQ